MTTGYLAALKLNGDLVKPRTECGAFAFLPGDIILFECSNSLFGRLERWALDSPWGHAGMIGRNGLLIESIGRGVLRRDLSTNSGRKIKVLRHQCQDCAAEAAVVAEFLADRPDAYYDYLGLIRWLIPHLLWYKLTHIAWHAAYKHDSRYWCSEFVSEAYSNALSLDAYEPLAPGDLDKSPCLNVVFEGNLP